MHLVRSLTGCTFLVTALISRSVSQRYYAWFLSPSHTVFVLGMRTAPFAFYRFHLANILVAAAVRHALPSLRSFSICACSRCRVTEYTRPLGFHTVGTLPNAAYLPHIMRALCSPKHNITDPERARIKCCAPHCNSSSFSSMRSCLPPLPPFLECVVTWRNVPLQRRMPPFFFFSGCRYTHYIQSLHRVNSTATYHHSVQLAQR